MRRWWLVWLLCAVAPGCERDITADNRGPTAARLHLNIDFLDAGERGIPAPGGVQIAAWLSPGIDQSGQWRPLPRDPLEVLNIRLDPSTTTRDQLSYGKTVPFDAGQFANAHLSIRAPALGTLIPSYEASAWRSVGRAGPQTLTRRLGEDIVLPIVHPTEPSIPRPEVEDWFLGAYNGNVQLVQFRGDGPLPAEITTPGGYLLRGSPSSVVVKLYTRAYRSEAAMSEGEYLVTPVVSTYLTWFVQLTP